MKQILGLVFASIFYLGNATQQVFSDYKLIFIYNSHTEVDFSKKTITNQSINYSSELQLPYNDAKAIEQYFINNHIGSLRGEMLCINPTIVQAPSTDYTIKVFRGKKLLTTIILDELYDFAHAKKLSKKYESAKFVRSKNGSGEK